MQIPLISEIQRFCLQDGPGIRTTLFVKGCPLVCPWCHNPEDRSPKTELYYYPQRCGHCLACAAACPHQATIVQTGPSGEATVYLDRTQCRICLQCVPRCHSAAREVVGQQLSMDEIMSELTADQPFFESSGGGVTLSGGEPMYFADFTLRLSRSLKKCGIHVAMETSGCAKREAWAPLLDSIDLFIIDLKTPDPAQYRDIIGCELDLVLNNIATLVASGADVRLHIPVIPGFNDTRQDFASLVEIIAPMADRLHGADILPYHCYGESKYHHLDKAYAYRGVEDLSKEAVAPLAERLKGIGVPEVTIGGISKLDRSGSQNSARSSN